MTFVPVLAGLCLCRIAGGGRQAGFAEPGGSWLPGPAPAARMRG